MDRLSRNAMLARQAGMSYGKWKALQPVVEPVKTEETPEGWQACEECGKPFKPGRGKRFCEYACREKNYHRRKSKKKAEYMRQYRARKEEENAG